MEKKEYKSFKELPLEKDQFHVLHLTAEFKTDIEEVVYRVKLECYLTKAWVTVLTTVREREAHGFIRRRAKELKCKFVDHTKGERDDSRPSTTS